MTELVQYQPQTALTDQMEYAKAVSSASMLPDNYRGKPADIMLAVGLGQSMGLSPAESLYRISVIKGKPTASAELVAANVRKAGHRLRVQIEPGKATATIVRADDPDFEFTVVRDAAWAQQMGLSDQPNYRKQGDTMLSWRAITAAARLACPEALYGVAYSTDEMYDGGERQERQDRSGGLGAALATTVLAEQAADPNTFEVEDAEARMADATVPESPFLNTSSSLAKAMFAEMGTSGVTEKADRLAICSEITGREITTSGDLTEAEASQIIDVLRAARGDGNQS